MQFTRIFYQSPKKIYERMSATAVLYGDYVYLYGGQRDSPSPKIPVGTIARFNMSKSLVLKTIYIDYEESI